VEENEGERNTVMVSAKPNKEEEANKYWSFTVEEENFVCNNDKK